MGRSHPHLSLEEHRKIAKWREAKMPVPEIADRLGRAASTIYRALKRNHYDDKELPEPNGYYALNAQAMYEKRRAIYRKMIVHPELKEAIEDRPKAGWSAALSNRSMKVICGRLNGTPRKCLGWHTPAEAFRAELMKLR